MKRRIVVFLVLLVSISQLLMANSGPADSVKLSLEEAWAKADAFSKELKLKNADIQIGQEELLNAKRMKLPHIEAEASYGKLSNIPVFVDGILESPSYIPIDDHSVYDASIDAYFNLYAGNKLRVQVQQAESRQDLLNYIADQTSSEVHYKVAQSYLALQRANCFLKLIEQNILQSEKRLAQISDLYDNGLVLKSDLLRAQLQLSQQQTNLLAMKNQLDLSTQQLNILIGNADEQAIDPTDSIAGDESREILLYSQYVEQTLQSSPLEKIAQTQVHLSKLAEKQAKSDKLPRIGLFGEYTYSYPQTKLYPYEQAPYLMGVAGLKISYNISAIYHDKHKEKAAAIRHARQELAHQQTNDQLRIALKSAYRKLHEDLAQVDVAKMSISQAAENYRIVNQTYFNQLTLLTDLLTADTQLLQARFDLVNRQLSARLHYYQILKITGQL
ncbi:TolC family protein [Mangrovibacterium marinum]|uniref:TolC family protein n=1 Tax=Mangrovibacterium marinum TaxID=1639118 RepID=UPI002A18CE55|nr:TolC family protein [Mangrovibacterium marinum]